MIPFTWLFGAAFWVGYVVFGLIFCVYYMRHFAKNVYKVVTGKFDRKDDDGTWRVGKTYVWRGDIALAICAGLFFWPITLLAVLFIGVIKLFFKTAAKTVMAAIQNTASKLPEIKIQTEKEKPSDL